MAEVQILPETDKIVKNFMKCFNMANYDDAVNTIIQQYEAQCQRIKQSVPEKSSASDAVQPL